VENSVVSRSIRNALPIPDGIEVAVAENKAKVKGAKVTLECDIPAGVEVKKEDKNLRIISHADALNTAAAGTMQALLRNMFTGVSKGYDKKLLLVGVGYRAQVQGKALNLQLGFSHPIKFEIPHGITIETPSQTEIVVRGADKQLVGQVAAQIRAYRPPEPYKGKGVRYDGEVIIQKEGKKK
jgi:large subunit ribosomal protein L6